MPWLEPQQQLADELLPDWFIRRWAETAATSRQADPVCCAPAWNLTYHEVFSPERPLFFTASDNALLILAEYITASGEPVLTPVEDSWLFGQPLLGEAAPALLLAELPRIRERYPAGLPRMFISGIQEKSLFAALLYNFFGRRYSLYIHSFNVQASASLRGGMDGWLSRRSANHRAKLRKASRRARDAGVVFERICPSPDDFEAVYGRMLGIEAKSWKGIGQCGMAEPPSRDFYAALMRRQTRGRKALVIFARLEGEDIGFIYGGCAADVYRGQQFSYAQSAGPLSIGNLMQMEKVAWLCELGIKRYDMGPVTGPKMGYKKHWTEEFYESQSWMIRF